MTISAPLDAMRAAPEVKPAPAPAPAPKKSSMADYNTFIKLLIAQMKNQDPTNPSDPTKYVSQLASFSAVEQATQTNQKLDALFVSNQISQAASYVGKHLKDDVAHVEGVIKSIKIYSDGISAILENGKEVAIQPGVIISNPEKAQA